MLLVEQLAVVVPAPAHLAAAAHVGDRERRHRGRAPTAGRSRSRGRSTSRRRRSRRAGPDRAGAAAGVLARPAPAHDRDRHPLAVVGGGPEPVLLVVVGVVGAPGRDGSTGARLSRVRLAAAHVVVVDRRRDGHAWCSRAAPSAARTSGCRTSPRCRSPRRTRPGSRRRRRASSSSRIRSWVSPRLRWCTTRWPANASTSSRRTAGSWAISGSHPSRGVGSIGATASSKSGPLALCSTRKRSSPPSTACSREYSTPSTRSAKHRNPSSGRSASSTWYSEVVFDPAAITRNRSVRLRPDPEPEPAVVLVEHQLVVGLRGAEPVPPDLVGPPGLVDGAVVEVSGRPGPR